MIDPCCDHWLVLAHASWLISQWPEDSVYDMALNNLATKTATLLIAPDPYTLRDWQQARAKHAALLLPA